MGHTAPVDFFRAIAGGYGPSVVLSAFIPAAFLRPALLGIRRVCSIAAPLAPRPGADLARVCRLSVSGKLRYSVLGGDIWNYCFSRLLILSHKYLIIKVI
jgi:hypothetical protein